MTTTDGMPMALYMSAMQAVAAAFEALGVLTVMLGTVIAAARGAMSLHTRPQSSAYRLFRQEVGSAILLGLEFLVAGDIIRSIVVSPSLENVAVLSLIVLTRIVLSIALQVELEGRWPWRRHEAERRCAAGGRYQFKSMTGDGAGHRNPPPIARGGEDPTLAEQMEAAQTANGHVALAHYCDEQAAAAGDR